MTQPHCEPEASHLDRLRPVVGRFVALAEPTLIEPFGSGHINDTYRVVHSDNSETVLQRLNGHVFRRPDQVMENIQRVCLHLSNRVENPERQTLRVIPTSTGEAAFRDEFGHYWRLLHRVHDVVSYDQIQSESQAHEVGRAFGEFQSRLSDLPAPRLHDTIADFHHTPRRYSRLLEVARLDPLQRLSEVQSEFDFARLYCDVVGRLVEAQDQGIVPERVTHNDTKLNNLLFDSAGKAQCVVDLDTVMPGLVHYDFGDMVRTAASRAREDEADLTLAQVDEKIFRSLVQGYLLGVKHFISRAELDLLAFSGLLMTYEVGVRFLTDYLEGDIYFKVESSEHNLRRARNQFALVRDLEGRMGWMEEVVRSSWAEVG